MAESMQGLKRTMRCGEVSEEMIGKSVTLMGWVAKCRNKGGIVFVDLRDRTGIIQIVTESEGADERWGSLKSESAIAVVGTVQKRGGAVNPNLKTGTIEVVPETLRILSTSETPPFLIQDGIDTREDLRLKYRYLDLRFPFIGRIPGHRDAEPYRQHAGGRAGLPGSEPGSSGLLLRAAAEPAALKAASDVLGL